MRWMPTFSMPRGASPVTGHSSSSPPISVGLMTSDEIKIAASGCCLASGKGSWSHETSKSLKKDWRPSRSMLSMNLIFSLPCVLPQVKVKLGGMHLQCQAAFVVRLAVVQGMSSSAVMLMHSKRLQIYVHKAAQWTNLQLHKM